MPWTGGAFLVGAMAIAGLPPLNGFASEWLTLQSLFAVPASGGVAEGLAGALALGALAATAALAVLCFVKVVGLVLLGQPRRIRSRRSGRCAVSDARLPLIVLAAACVVLGVVPGALAGPARRPRALADRRRAERATRGAVGTTRCRRPGSRSSSSSGQRFWSQREEGGAQHPRQAGRAVSRSDPSSPGRVPDSRSRCDSCSRRRSVPTRDISQSVRGGVLQEVRYEGHVPHLFETHLNRPVTRVGLWAAARARRVQSGSLTAYVAYLVALVIVLLAAVRIGVIG